MLFRQRSRCHKMVKFGFYLITTIRLSVLKVLAYAWHLLSVLLAPFQSLPAFSFSPSFSLPLSRCKDASSLSCFRVPVFGSGFAVATQRVLAQLSRIATNNKAIKHARYACWTRAFGAHRLLRRYMSLALNQFFIKE